MRLLIEKAMRLKVEVHGADWLDEHRTMLDSEWEMITFVGFGRDEDDSSDVHEGADPGLVGRVLWDVKSARAPDEIDVRLLDARDHAAAAIELAVGHYWHWVLTHVNTASNDERQVL